MNAYLSELEMLRARLKNERLGFEERELLCRLIIAAEDAQRETAIKSGPLPASDPKPS